MMVGRRSVPFGRVTFQGRTVKFPRCTCLCWFGSPLKIKDSHVFWRISHQMGGSIPNGLVVSFQRIYEELMHLWRISQFLHDFHFISFLLFVQQSWKLKMATLETKLIFQDPRFSTGRRNCWLITHFPLGHESGRMKKKWPQIMSTLFFLDRLWVSPWNF